MFGRGERACKAGALPAELHAHRGTNIHSRALFGFLLASIMHLAGKIQQWRQYCLYFDLRYRVAVNSTPAAFSLNNGNVAIDGKINETLHRY